MFKHAIGDDGLKVIKSFTYSEGENANDWRVVMGKMEKHCIGEVNEIYERYCFNKRFPTETVDNFVAELKTLAKTCNVCDCLRDSLIRDRIVLGIKNEQTTKKLLRMRDLTLNRCIDVCRREEVTSMQMKSLSEPVDNVNLVKPTGKKSQRSSDGKLNMESPVSFVGLSIHQRKRSAQRGVRRAKSVNRRIILLRSVPGEQQFIILEAKKSLRR